MLRVFHPDIPAAGTLSLSAVESHHLVRVRRASKGDLIVVLDGQGTVAEAAVIETHPKAATLEIRSRHELASPAPPLILVQAVPKAKGMESIVHRAAEFGVSRIFPIFTDHGEMQLSGDRIASKAAKWEAAATEAIKQCGNPWRPVLEPAARLDTVLAEIPDDSVGIVASLRPPVRSVRSLFRDLPAPARPVVVAIGPEGDFSRREYDLFQAHGWHSVTLGPLVLRVETATCALLALTLAEIREYSPHP